MIFSDDVKETYLVLDKVAGNESLGAERLDDILQLLFFPCKSGVLVSCLLTNLVVDGWFSGDTKVRGNWRP